MPVYIFTILLSLFSTGSVAGISLNLSEPTDWLAVNGGSFGEKVLEPGLAFELNLTIKNDDPETITLENLSQGEKRELCWDFFTAVDPQKSTCRAGLELKPGEECIYVLALRPNQQLRLINKQLYLGITGSNGQFKEIAFSIDGSLALKLSTNMLGEKDPKEVLPRIIFAEARSDDPWFPYIQRPTKDSAANSGLYPTAILNKSSAQTFQKVSHMPTTFIAVPEGDMGLHRLMDVVADRIYDKDSNKTYLKMYHGTTDDLLDVFKPGESAIRFDVAVTRALGQGFYLTANINEAKAYACSRWKERVKNKTDLKGMIMVVGVEENDIIKGKYSYNAHLSDDATGDPFDPEIYFKRNGKMNNQFVFFSNTKPYLKIYDIVVLPNGFGRSKGLDDKDGIPENRPNPENTAGFSCK